MARIYQITEEEMQSLIDSLKLEAMNDQNLLAAGETPTKEEMHRSFHYVVVRWAQAMGFDGYRK